MPLYGGIEAGGTKIVCAVGTGPDDVRAEIRFPTSAPAEVFPRAIAFFREQAAREPLAGIGIAAFGPVDPDPRSPTYGYVTNTPKPGWAHTDFAGTFQRALGVPVGFDTDVNVAALGEYRWGAAQGLDTFIYLTVGTGIGGGVMINGQLLHGLMHPEMGHLRVPHDFRTDPFPGCCIYHADCMEGLCGGPAIEARTGQRGETLSPDHPVWELVSHYLGLGLADYVLTLCPKRIIMGGGVMVQDQLFPRIRAKVQQHLCGYIQVPELTTEIDSFIVPPMLGGRAGVLGAIALAEIAAGDRKPR
ncbi:MAG: ROK family protein [Anaerolineae bacterium]